MTGIRLNKPGSVSSRGHLETGSEDHPTYYPKGTWNLYLALKLVAYFHTSCKNLMPLLSIQGRLRDMFSFDNSGFRYLKNVKTRLRLLSITRFSRGSKTPRILDLCFTFHGSSKHESVRQSWYQLQG